MIIEGETGRKERTQWEILLFWRQI